MSPCLLACLLQFFNSHKEPTEEAVPERCNFVSQSAQDVFAAITPVDLAFTRFYSRIHKYLPPAADTLALSTGVAKVQGVTEVAENRLTGETLTGVQ